MLILCIVRKFLCNTKWKTYLWRNSWGLFLQPLVIFLARYFVMWRLASMSIKDPGPIQFDAIDQTLSRDQRISLLHQHTFNFLSITSSFTFYTKPICLRWTFFAYTLAAEQRSDIIGKFRNLPPQPSRFCSRAFLFNKRGKMDIVYEIFTGIYRLRFCCVIYKFSLCDQLTWWIFPDWNFTKL